MKKELLQPKGLYSGPARGIAHGIKVGNTIYVAGQVAFDENRNVIGIGDCTRQAEQVFENIKKVLAEGGATLNDVVKFTTFVKGFENMQKVRAVRARYFHDEYYPAHTMICIDSLIVPELLVEIEAVAVI